MWEYDDDEGRWQDEETKYSYDPADDKFGFQDNLDLSMEEVPLGIRQELESTAREKILEIIGDAASIDEGPAVKLTSQFEQGQPIATVALTDQTIFGSLGATPCLIIFSVGFSRSKATYYAKGAHRCDVYLLPAKFFEDMSSDPGTELSDLQFYIVGGEVGSHTGAEGATMDYSRYFPFFLQSQQSEIKLGGIRFPSNPTPDDTTSAALRLVQSQPKVYFRLAK